MKLFNTVAVAFFLTFIAVISDNKLILKENQLTLTIKHAVLASKFQTALSIYGVRLKVYFSLPLFQTTQLIHGQLLFRFDET